MDKLIIHWEFRIPEPDDGCHISIWYALQGAEFVHAVTHHVFYRNDINIALDILEHAYPGKNVEFERGRGVIYVHRIYKEQ